MGASGWDHRAAHEGDLERTLRAMQEVVLASGDYLWPWEDFDEDYLADDEMVARPTTLADLDAAKEHEDFWEGGTHSILDVTGERVDPLSAEELRTVFGTERPSATDFERVHEPGPSGVLEDLMGDKWTARSLTIFAGDEASEVYIWGWSGD
jgi:hypothetical protein